MHFSNIHIQNIMSELKEITITRKQLCDMVWSEPLSRLAKKYQISDNGLRKICRRMKIPLPPNGPDLLLDDSDRDKLSIELNKS